MQQKYNKPVVIADWPGLMSDADAHDIPPGAAQSQDNAQSITSGLLSVRKGIQQNTVYMPSSPSTPNAISCWAFPRQEGTFLMTADDAGNIKARRASDATTIASSRQTFATWSAAVDRKGRCVMVNGFERGLIWDALTATAEDLGITAPSSAPTGAAASGGNATAGDYALAYRYLDDELPTATVSSLSDADTVTATASQKFTWSDLTASSESRVTKVQLWRSASGVSNVLYYITEFNHDGTITSSATNGGSVQFTSTAHGLVAGATIDVTGHSVGGYNTEHQVVSVDSANTFTTDIAYSSDGTGGTWQAEGYNTDTASDTTLISNAVSDVTKRLVILNPNDSINARRFDVPPNRKRVVVQFQDRFWYAVDPVYTTGTVAINGTTTVTGTGTSWTTEMAGRYMYVDGSATPLVISSVGSTTSITLETAPSETGSGLSYSIMVPPDERNTLNFSHPDEPESVLSTDIITPQQNVLDPDDNTALAPFGSILYVFQNRHTYAVSYYAQPKIDANVRLIAQRGCFNQQSYDIYEGRIFVMDQYGAYTMGPGGGVEPTSTGKIQDLWDDGTIDMAKSEWFFTQIDPETEVCRYWVVYAADSGDRPTRCLAYSIRDGRWWTESYMEQMGGSCRLRVTNRMRVALAGEDENAFLHNAGNTDFVSSEIRGTATSATSTTIADTGAPFSSSQAGAPVGIVSGTGKGQIRRITSATSTTLTVPTWDTTPDTTSVYLVGAIKWNWKSGIFSIARDDQTSSRGVELVYTPTTGQAYLDIRRYWNHESTPENNTISDKQMNALIVRTAGDPDDVVDLYTSRSSKGNAAGFAHAGFAGLLADRTEGNRYISIELRGFQGDDQIVIHEMLIHGAG